MTSVLSANPSPGVQAGLPAALREALASLPAREIVLAEAA